MEGCLFLKAEGKHRGMDAVVRTYRGREFRYLCMTAFISQLEVTSYTARVESDIGVWEMGE